MSLRPWLAAPVMAVVALTPVALPRPAADAAARQRVSSQTPAQTPASTLNDQVDLAVTVYNSSLALVRDTRDVSLARGASDLEFEDVAATIDPTSVHFRSLTDPSHVNVLEQNYEYDLLAPDKLLHKYVGRDVTLVRTRQANGETRDETVTARLLSDNGAPVWRIGNDIVTGLAADSYRFADVPDNLYARPTLIWSLENDGGARQRVEASYLASQLSWNATYVLTVARDDKTADLDGWVTLANNSGTSFRNASLQLVAGDLNRVTPRAAPMIQAASGGGRGGGGQDNIMVQENFSEYHLYTLTRKTSINNDETKQVSMLSGTGFPVEKRYVVNGQTYYYRSAMPGAPTKTDVDVFYQFKNQEGAGLGMPLPAGTIRVYQADSHGGTQFAGEDHIDHTPKDEEITLKVGTAFDVVAERKQVDFERISSNVYESEYQVTIRNHKSDAITVDVNEPIGGTWQILHASHPFTKTAAFAAQFELPVAADGTATLDYRVRVTY